MRSTGGVDAANDLLQRALSAVAEVDVDVSDHADTAKLSALKVLQPLAWAAEAQVTRFVGAAHTSGAVNADGYPCTASWLRAHLRTGDAGVQVRAARALALAPKVAAVYAHGECSRDHVRAVAAVVDDIPAAMLAGGVDKLLAEQAAQGDPATFARLSGGSVAIEGTGLGTPSFA